MAYKLVDVLDNSGDASDNHHVLASGLMVDDANGWTIAGVIQQHVDQEGNTAGPFVIMHKEIKKERTGAATFL